MEIYSFNKKEMEKKYNKILNLYHNTDNIAQKIKLHSQLLELSNYLQINKPITDIRKDELRNYYNGSQVKSLEKLKEIEDLTIDLCHYWSESLRNINYENKIILKNNLLDKESYFRELSLFFEKVMPTDGALFKKTFEEQKILVKKRFLLSKAEMIYLESIKEYYIKILYCGKLNKITTRNTIHEFGHVSEFMKTGIGKSKDQLMGEVIATLYELLYIDYCFPKDNKSKLIEFSNLFKIITLSPLVAYIYQNNNNLKYLNEIYFNEITYMYTDIIAASIYLKKNEPDFQEKLSYIKANTPHIDTFKLLSNIGIKEQDLLYNSKNIKKLILERG